MIPRLDTGLPPESRACLRAVVARCTTNPGRVLAERFTQRAWHERLRRAQPSALFCVMLVLEYGRQRVTCNACATNSGKRSLNVYESASIAHSAARRWLAMLPPASRTCRPKYLMQEHDCGSDEQRLGDWDEHIENANRALHHSTLISNSRPEPPRDALIPGAGPPSGRVSTRVAPAGRRQRVRPRAACLSPTSR